MPSLCEFEELKYQEYDGEKLLEIFQKLEFNSFIDKLALRSSITKDDINMDIKVVENISELKLKVKYLVRSCIFIT